MGRRRAAVMCEVNAMTTDRTSVEGKRETIRRLFAAMSGGNLKAALAFYTDDRPTYSFPRGNVRETCCGKAAMRTLFRRVRTRYRSALVFVPRAIIVEGNIGFIEWDQSALTAGGKPYTNSGVHVIEFTADGLIQHARSYLDTGPLPPPPPSERRND
jgi:ketosteroid isomerase-like protein